MKPTTLFFSLLSAISVSTLTLPSLAQTTSIPVSGGFSVVVFATGGINFSYGTVLSSLGPISNISVGQIIGAPLQATGPNVSVGDTLSFAGTSSGDIISAGGIASFSDAPTNLIATVTFVSGTIPYSNPPTQNENFEGTFTGSVLIPSSIIPITPNSSNSPISSIIPLNDVDASNLFNSQPVLESGKNFLPPSSLAGSRIHPDLSSR